MTRILLILLFVAAPLTSAFAQLSLTTTFEGGNGNDGAVFFDIENLSNVPITILAWDTNLECDGNPSTSISIYTRSGTASGFEMTPIGWTLQGTDASVICAPTGSPSRVDIGGILLPGGSTTGVAIVINQASDDISHSYTDGNGSNEVYNNGSLELVSYSNSDDPFEPGDLNEPRVWNGTVFYEGVPTNVPTLSEWGLIAMAGVLGIVGFMVIRRRQLAS